MRSVLSTKLCVVFTAIAVLSHGHARAGPATTRSSTIEPAHKFAWTATSNQTLSKRLTERLGRDPIADCKIEGRLYYWFEGVGVISVHAAVPKVTFSQNGRWLTGYVVDVTQGATVELPDGNAFRTVGSVRVETPEGRAEITYQLTLMPSDSDFKPGQDALPVVGDVVWGKLRIFDGPSTLVP